MTRAAKALLICSAAFVSLVLFTAPIAFAPASPGASAFAAEQPLSTTIPDSTFGEGGTKESRSNDKHELLLEIWRDSNGIVREQFELDTDGMQYWGFYNGDGVNTTQWRKSMIAVRPMERPAGRWQMWVIGPGDMLVKELSTLSKTELDTEFAYWHTQLRTWVNNALRQQRGNG